MQESNTIENFNEESVENLKALLQAIKNYSDENIEASDLERKLTHNHLDIDSMDEMREALEEVLEEKENEASIGDEVLYVEHDLSDDFQDALKEKAEEYREKAEEYDKEAGIWERKGDEKEAGYKKNTAEYFRRKARRLEKKHNQLAYPGSQIEIEGDL